MKDNLNDRIKLYKSINVFFNKIKEKLGDTCIRNNKIGTEITVGKQISKSGSYGVVYSAYFTNLKELEFVIKIAEKIDVNKKDIEVGMRVNEILINKICPNFLFQYNNYSCQNSYYILNELAAGTLSELIFKLIKKNKSINSDIIFNALSQIYMSIICFNKYLNLNHNDAHYNNILYRKVRKGGCYHYILFGENYYIKNLGYQYYLNDFGLASNLTSYKKDLIFFTEKIMEYSEAGAFTDDINGYLKDLLILLKRPDSQMKEIFKYIFKYDVYIHTDKIINKQPYIIETLPGARPQRISKPSTVAKVCGEGKILNPKTNRCIDANGTTAKKLGLTQKRPRGRPKKIKPEEPVPPSAISEVIPDEYNSLSKEEKQLKKNLPSSINPRYIFNVDFLIDQLKNSGNSKSYIISQLDIIRNDLIDIMKETDAADIKNANTKEKYKRFGIYNDTRITKIYNYRNQLIK
jgi:hypothetical protein